MDTSTNAPIIDIDDAIEKTEKLLEDYFDAKMYHNNTEFPMSLEKVKEERTSVLSSIYLFNKSKLTYYSVNYLFIEKLEGDKTRHKNVKDMDELSISQVNNDNPIKPK